MQSAPTNVFARDDTFFGVCEALGEDLGFNPQYLRVALGVLLLVNPVAVIAGYFAVGLVIASIRWLVPNPRRAIAAGAEALAAAHAAPRGDNDAEALAAAA